MGSHQVMGSRLIDPGWLLYDIVAPRDECLWLKLNESILRHASFLDQRILPEAQQKLKTPLSVIHQAVLKQEYLAHIFHCGHVGSTLLSRILAGTDRVLPVREPLVLRTLSAVGIETDKPWSVWDRTKWESILSRVYAVLSRPYRSGQTVLVKATSICTNLIDSVLVARPHDKIIGIYATFDLYFAAMTRDPSLMLDLNGHLVARFKEYDRLSGGSHFALHELDPLQIIALSWLVNLQPMLNAASHTPERVQLVDFAGLMENTIEESHRSAAFLGFPLPDDIDTIRRSYAKKQDMGFDPQRRWKELLELARSQKQVRKMARSWLDQVIEDCEAYRLCREFLDHTLIV